MTALVSLHNVTKRYHRGDETVIALDHFSLAVYPGEMVALAGPSGCGKSTCLNLISGVDQSDEGTIEVCGVTLGTADEKTITILRRRRIGIVFQSFYLMPHLSVEENIALPLALDSLSDPERVRELVHRVGLEHRLHHYPSELSGGEQQRTAVARALVHRPQLVIADEPTGNLDSHSGTEVLQLMNELRRQENTALIMATHDREIARMADRIVPIRDGKIESTGTS
ncbi:MAG: ABC transporter ATP-binding protein [bacterium]